MPRAIWSGSISFGLVNVPVKLYTATEHKNISFHQLEKGSGERIRYQRVAQSDNHEVDYDDIVKGYEVDDGEYVVVTPEELEGVAAEQTRAIDIEDFVDLSEVDPIYFEKSYYLAPGKGADKPYALLREAMAKTGKAAIARFVLRTKQYLALLRAQGDVLVLETLFFADEIRPADSVGDLPAKADVAKKELDVAVRLIDSLTTSFDASKYDDTYREAVMELIEKKAEGEDVVIEKASAPKADVVDLMAALEASLEEAGKGRKRRKAS